MAQRQVIHIHRDAPPKPAPGAPCNGCGVCCLAEPCPLGIVLGRRLSGPCAALRWSAPARRYECGALTTLAQGHLLQRIAGRAVRRWIAAGRGCDSLAETARP
jgi:hypothetical protein